MSERGEADDVTRSEPHAHPVDPERVARGLAMREMRRDGRRHHGLA